MAQERERLAASDLTTRQARDWYREHRASLDAVHRAAVTWVRLDDEPTARSVLAASQGLTRRQFLERVRPLRSQGAEIGRAELTDSGVGADVEVVRVAFAV